MTISVKSLKKGDYLVSKSKSMFYPNLKIIDKILSDGQLIYAVGRQVDGDGKLIGNMYYIIYSELVNNYKKRVLCVKAENDIYVKQIRAYHKRKQVTLQLYYSTIFEARKRNPHLTGFEYV